MKAGALDCELVFPDWVADLQAEWEEDVDRINAGIYKLNHAQSWHEVHQNWSEGYLRLIESAEPVAEKDLLDGSRYDWLNGYSLAFVLVASYDHHQEHFEKLIAWLEKLGLPME